MRILAIDPGNELSAFCIMDDDYRPAVFNKIDNVSLLTDLLLFNEGCGVNRAVIEMVSSYGMPVGAEVFETCVWIGRFQQELAQHLVKAELIMRGPVKLHHCGSAKAKDGNIAQALRDRFGQKGTKANPGWFYGFKADIWQAYALAVYAADTMNDEQGAA